MTKTIKKMTILTAINNSLRYIEKELKREKDAEMKEMWEKDLKEYKIIEDHIKEGYHSAARNTWERMDTAARDYIRINKNINTKQSRTMIKL